MSLARRRSRGRQRWYCLAASWQWIRIEWKLRCCDCYVRCSSHSQARPDSACSVVTRNLHTKSHLTHHRWIGKANKLRLRTIFVSFYFRCRKANKRFRSQHHRVITSGTHTQWLMLHESSSGPNLWMVAATLSDSTTIAYISVRFMGIQDAQQHTLLIISYRIVFFLLLVCALRFPFFLSICYVCCCCRFLMFVLLVMCRSPLSTISQPAAAQLNLVRSCMIRLVSFIAVCHCKRTYFAVIDYIRLYVRNCTHTHTRARAFCFINEVWLLKSQICTRARARACLWYVCAQLKMHGKNATASRKMWRGEERTHCGNCRRMRFIMLEWLFDCA